MFLVLSLKMTLYNFQFLMHLKSIPLLPIPGV